jgi:GDP-4-dehydro-6-deoxy-D-mannose reductase
VRALVTGAGGFCGSHLVKRLEEDGVEVHSVGTRIVNRDRHHVIRSVSDVSGLSQVIRATGPDYVFHLAGISTANDSADYYRVNSGYAATLLDALDADPRTNCPLLLTGSSAEYGPVPRQELPITEEFCARPVTHYGISKLSQTQMGLAANRLERGVVVVRPFNVVGPGMPPQLALQAFATQIAHVREGLSPAVIKVGNLNTSRDFVDVRDVAATYWDAIRTSACYGQIVNVCSGLEIRLSDALSMMLEIAGIEVETQFDPARLRKFDIDAHYGSNRKLETLLGPRQMRPLANTLEVILADVSSRL